VQLELGPLERLPAHKGFDVQGEMEPMQVGGEEILFLDPVRVVGTVDRMVGGARVHGEVEAKAQLRCGRCLDPYAVDLRWPIDLYLYGPGAFGHVPQDEEEAQPYQERLDLKPAAEEAIVLALPIRPLCSEDCPGLCPHCGERRTPHHQCAGQEAAYGPLGDQLMALWGQRPPKEEDDPAGKPPGSL
jgi:uncharacterized protein